MTLLIPVVAELVAITGRRGISDASLAAVIGVHRNTPSRWRSGYRVPSFGHTLGWATFVGRRVAAMDENDEILAEGEAIPGQLKPLRLRAKLSLEDAAELTGKSLETIDYREKSTRPPKLSTIDEQLTAIGCRLVLPPL
ncbi:helix-turn-helix domain-containing protein [Microtetraspora malaysiensis]|uniref:Helix-turn-helix domain-containing protein n=1 Tax=Microtetraspora malaysiensis TaxID=161358 RepID=A0ABW6SMU8_9ACTN